MKNPTPYLKMRVLGAIDMAPGDSIIARIREVSKMSFTDEDGHPRSFTWSTIQTWLSYYKKYGLTRLQNQKRRDSNRPRKITPEALAEIVREMLPKLRGTPKRATLYRMCIEQGLITRSQIAPNTFSRLVARYELFKPDRDATGRHRLAFAKPHANDMWQADTLVGPYMKNDNGAPVQTRLIAFIDDASRVCCHGEFFINENVDSLVAALRSALYKRGLAASLYMDNGAIYSSREITQICARLGILLAHTPLRDGAAKGKIERFFRTVRDQFLSRELDLSSLAALNRQFIQWVEENYNAQKHSILGMSPLDRFAMDRGRIRFLPPNETNDEAFFAEDTRHTRADNTFNFKSVRYEAPRHLPERAIQIRCQRSAAASRTATRVIVYYKGERMGEARPLDMLANDRRPSPPPARQQSSPMPSNIQLLNTTPSTPSSENPAAEPIAP